MAWIALKTQAVCVSQPIRSLGQVHGLRGVENGSGWLLHPSRKAAVPLEKRKKPLQAEDVWRGVDRDSGSISITKRCVCRARHPQSAADVWEAMKTYAHQCSCFISAGKRFAKGETKGLGAVALVASQTRLSSCPILELSALAVARAPRALVCGQLRPRKKITATLSLTSLHRVFKRATSPQTRVLLPSISHSLAGSPAHNHHRSVLFC